MNSYKKANRVFLLTLLVYLGGSFAVAFLAPGISENVYESVIVSQILLLLVPMLYCLKDEIDVPRAFWIKPIRLSTALIAILCTALIYPLLATVNAFSMLFVSSGTEDVILNMMGDSVAMGVVFIALVPGIVEETVFRGLFYSHYRQGGMFMGAIFSSLVFGCMHLNINQFLYTLLFGIFLTMIVEATGSIMTTMLCHMTLNASSYLMSVMSYSLVGQEGMEESYDAVASASGSYMTTVAVLALVSLFTTLGAFGVYVWLCKHTGRLNHVKEFMKKDDIKRITPCYIIALIIAFAYMVLSEILI